MKLNIIDNALLRLRCLSINVLIVFVRSSDYDFYSRAFSLLLLIYTKNS